MWYRTFIVRISCRYRTYSKNIFIQYFITMPACILHLGGTVILYSKLCTESSSNSRLKLIIPTHRMLPPQSCASVATCLSVGALYRTLCCKQHEQHYRSSRPINVHPTPNSVPSVLCHLYHRSRSKMHLCTSPVPC